MNIYEILSLIAQAVKSGLPLHEAIRLCVDQPARGAAQRLLQWATLLEKGTSPSDAAKQAGLPDTIQNLVQSAQNSKDFSQSFELLVREQLNQVLLKQKIRHVLAYPICLFISCCLAFWYIVVFTVPKFIPFFEDMQIELPLLTQVFIFLIQPFSDPVWLAAVIFACLGFYGLIQWCFPQFWYSIPIVGRILHCVIMTQMLRQLALSIRLELTLPEALEACQLRQKNRFFRKKCSQAAIDAREGMDFPEIVLRYYWLFPTWLAPIVATSLGNTQSLADSLERSAETVELQKDTAVLALNMLALPLVIIFVFNVLVCSTAALMLPLAKQFAILC